MDELDLGATIKGFSPGQKLFGRYTLKKQLGRGGMGVVWQARDESLEQDVAIKLLPEMVATDPVSIRELKRETRRSQGLAHPHILKVHDFVEGGGLCGISMELVEGGTLSARRLEEPGETFTPAQLGTWVRQLCEALDYAHKKAKVVHRDLKPANLMLTPDGDLKVADFGIAASLSESVTRVSKQAGSSGTPLYMSPQQMMGDDPAVTDDLYALGATLYELLTGKPPFFSGNVLLQVQSKVPVTVNERLRANGHPGEPVPAEWEETIAACLAKEPKDRPQSAGEVAERLGLAASPNVQHSTLNAQRSNEANTARRVNRPDEPRSQLQTPNPKYQTPTKFPLTAALVVGALLAVGIPYYFVVFAPLQDFSSRQAASDSVPDPQVAYYLPGRQVQEAAEAKAKLEQERLAAVNKPTAGSPWENSLGQKFVPVPGTGVLFCVWETRVQDFEAFVRETGHDVTKGMYSDRGEGFLHQGDTWKSPGFPQSNTHPVVGVGWEDAEAFCVWLTKKERASGLLAADQEYRLPRTQEWDAAVGKGEFPWGGEWPPPKGAGNYADEAAKRGRNKGLNIISSYDDGFDTTAPAGSFSANSFGIYDLGGNVRELVGNPIHTDQGMGMDTCGGSFRTSGRYDLASSTSVSGVWNNLDDVGFRLVVTLR